MTARTPSYLKSTEFALTGSPGRIGPGDLQDFVDTLTVRTPISAQEYGAIGNGASNPASANGYATLAALQVVYPFATSLTNEMDWLGIQAALNAAVALPYGGTVYVGPGTFILSSPGLSMTASVQLTGVSANSTTFLCGNCGTTPAITIVGSETSAASSILLSNMMLLGFNAGYESGTGGEGSSAGGTPCTTMYVSGSSAIYIDQVWGAEFEGLQISNFDEPCTFSTSGNTWLCTWRRCWFVSNNKGMVIDISAPNSFERMVYEDCLSCNNNYGTYFNLTNSSSLGGQPASGDIYIIGCSLDYNIVAQVYYIGGADTYSGDQDDIYSCLSMSATHIETDSGCSGSTNTPIFNDGNLVMRGCFSYLGGTYPPGWISGTFYCRTTVQGCVIPGGYPTMPIFYNSTSNYASNRVRGGGNTQRTGFSGDCILISDPTGNRMDTPSDGVAQDIVASGPIQTTLAMQRHLQILTSNTTAYNIEIYLDSTADHMIGTVLRYVSTGTSVWTFVPDSGVTLTSTGTTNGFGGAGKEVGLVKTAANTWLAFGDMT